MISMPSYKEDRIEHEDMCWYQKNKEYSTTKKNEMDYNNNSHIVARLPEKKNHKGRLIAQKQSNRSETRQKYLRANGWRPIKS